MRVDIKSLFWGLAAGAAGGFIARSAFSERPVLPNGSRPQIPNRSTIQHHAVEQLKGFAMQGAQAARDRINRGIAAIFEDPEPEFEAIDVDYEEINR